MAIGRRSGEAFLAWIDLGETERLYLEGAEDFDRLTGLSAETIQTKDVTGNITLRSVDVVEAIDNAWANQQRNPQYTIKFRFLTTSGIGGGTRRALRRRDWWVAPVA